MSCVVLNISFRFVVILLFKVFTAFHSSAHRMPISSTVLFPLARLLAPTQSRSTSPFMFGVQCTKAGKRGQAGDTKETARGGIGQPRSYSGMFVFCFTFAGFVECLQLLLTFSTHQCFAIALFLFFPSFF